MKPVSWPEIAFIGAVAALLALVSAAVHAKPPQNADPELKPWFEGLTNPTIGMSCCATADGHILSDKDWRTVKDGYEIRQGDHWVPVPPEAVLQNQTNPTGGAVAFFPPSGAPPIYCFVLPNMS